MKKSKGSGIVIEELFGGLTVIIAICVLVVVTMDVFQVFVVNEDAKEIARAYLLEMETVGYLSAESQADLLQELAAVGVTDVDISGTTLTDVGYGNRIYLCIKGSVPSKELNTSGDGFFSLFFEEKEWNIDIKRMSTSKR